MKGYVASCSTFVAFLVCQELSMIFVLYFSYYLYNEKYKRNFSWKNSGPINFQLHMVDNVRLVGMCD